MLKEIFSSIYLSSKFFECEEMKNVFTDWCKTAQNNFQKMPATTTVPSPSKEVFSSATNRFITTANCLFKSISTEDDEVFKRNEW